jgi:hypothetical protein
LGIGGDLTTPLFGAEFMEERDSSSLMALFAALDPGGLGFPAPIGAPTELTAAGFSSPFGVEGSSSSSSSSSIYLNLFHFNYWIKLWHLMMNVNTFFERKGPALFLKVSLHCQLNVFLIRGSTRCFLFHLLELSVGYIHLLLDMVLELIHESLLVSFRSSFILRWRISFAALMKLLLDSVPEIFGFLSSSGNWIGTDVYSTGGHPNGW